MYTTKQTAKILGYASAGVIRVMLQKKMIKGIKKGRDWFIPQSEIDRCKVARSRAGIINK
jgi:hypothetical protein